LGAKRIEKADGSKNCSTGGGKSGTRASSTGHSGKKRYENVVSWKGKKLGAGLKNIDLTGSISIGLSSTKSFVSQSERYRKGRISSLGGKWS